MSHHNKADLPSPWAEFLDGLDALLQGPAHLHCMGGFVAAHQFGLPRTTGDIDYNSLLSNYSVKDLQEMAGPESALARKHKVHLQYVAVSSMPEDYETRLTEMLSRRFNHLHLHVPDPYDFILSKLERNSSKDRDDVEFVAKTLRLKPLRLKKLYEEELRPYLANEARHDLTLKLWIDACF